MRALVYVLARLREPSTHASIAAWVTLLAILFPAHKAIIIAVGGVFATIGMATPDATSTADSAPAPQLAAEMAGGS